MSVGFVACSFVGLGGVVGLGFFPSSEQYNSKIPLHILDYYTTTLVLGSTIVTFMSLITVLAEVTITRGRQQNDIEAEIVQKQT